MTSFLKRRSVHLSALGCAAIGLTGCASTAGPVPAPKAETKELFAMNTYFALTAYGTQAGEALDHAEQVVRIMEERWSVVDPDSELYHINHSDGTATAISWETADLLALALDMAQETGGAFDPTIYPMLTAWGFTTREYHIPTQEQIDRILPNVGYEKVELDEKTVLLPAGMQLDFGGIAKGAAGSQLAQLLRDTYGVQSALLNLGGNVQTIGCKPDGTRWRIGIRSPYDESMLGVAEVEDETVVTSGGYERYFTGEDGSVYWHILDPDTGKPANSGLLSVTVFGSQGAACDALSTALFVMGLEDATDYWNHHSGFEMLLVTDDNKLYLTEGLVQRFTPSEMGEALTLYVLKRKTKPE